MFIGFVGRVGKEMDQLFFVFIRKLVKDLVFEDVCIDLYNFFVNFELEILSIKKVKWDGVVYNWSFGDMIMCFIFMIWIILLFISLIFGMFIKVGIFDVVSVEIFVLWFMSFFFSQLMIQSKDKILIWFFGGWVNGFEEVVE